MLVMLGIGETGLLQALFSSPHTQFKDLRICAFPGDVVPPREQWPKSCIIERVESWVDAQRWVQCHFSDHNDIVRLGGVDIIDDHPLGEAAELLRMDLKPRILAMLTDRPWSLGNDLNDTFMGLWHAAQNAPRVLPMPSIGQLAAQFGQIPCVSIGAGPSLGSRLDELRALQNKCLLVSCDAAYPGLVKEGIIPHFVTPLERLQQQAPLLTAAEGTRTVFAGIAACHPDALKPFGDRAIYFHAMDKLYDWLAPQEHLRCLTGSSTGVLSFYIAASLARGPVFLVGHDLSTSGVGSHWDGAALAKGAFTTEKAQSGGHGANGYETRLIPGNGGGMVESIMWWDNFRSEISGQAALISDRVFNVNAAHGVGAVIEHTKAAPLPDPTSLPDIPDYVPQAVSPGRLASWQKRRKSLGADCDNFCTAMERLRKDIKSAKRENPNTWDLEAMMARVAPDTGVSPGNAAAFQYVMRSALYNEQVRMSNKARGFLGKLDAQWNTLCSLDALADAMTVFVGHMKPLLAKP